MSTVDTSTAEELNQGGSDFILTSLEAMRKKLLDLTSRNRLLNFLSLKKGLHYVLLMNYQNSFMKPFARKSRWNLLLCPIQLERSC